MEWNIVKGYTAIKKLGSGGFGNVYQALNKDGEQVVIKKVRKTEESFNEIRIMETLGDTCNQYFSCLISHLETDKFLFIIMEYLNGYILLSDLKEFNSKFLNKVCINLCNGLKLMHSLGVVHNDIKTDNIMVSPITGEIKYIDFGGASKKGEKASTKTFRYVDPELLYYSKGKFRRKKVDFDSLREGDLWSLGIVIYKLVLNNTPYGLYEFEGTEDEKRYDYFMHYNYLDDDNRENLDKYLKKINSPVNMHNLLNRNGIKNYYC